MKHRTVVEADRRRVVCEGCTWFHYDAAASVDDLRERGRQHARYAKEFDDARAERD